MNDIRDQAMTVRSVAGMKRVESYEEGKARRLSPDVYHVMIFVVKYSVKESGRCRSMKFNVWTSLGEHYENIWYSTGRFGKPDLYREDRRDTGINGFLKRCLIRNVEALNDSDIETASESRPITFHIDYQYAPAG